MRAVQYEMQHWLGGQLTSVCMAGMSLLQPMETMVSYVMGGQQRGSRGSAKPLGAVLEQIEVREPLHSHAGGSWAYQPSSKAVEYHGQLCM